MVDDWHNAPPPEDPGEMLEFFEDPGRIGEDRGGNEEVSSLGPKTGPAGEGQSGSGVSLAGSLGAVSPAGEVDLQAEVAARIQAEETKPEKKPEEKAGSADGGSGGVDDDFVQLCLAANELGDGLLFSELLKGQYIFNVSAGEWLTWADHFWQLDERETVLAAVETVAERYLETAEKLGGEISAASKKIKNLLAAAAAAEDDKTAENNQAIELATRQVEILKEARKAFNKRVDKLRSERGRQACLKFARSNHRLPLVCLSSQLDQEPMLLATPSGVVDLETGLLRPGRHKDFITKAAATPFLGIDGPPTLFHQTLLEIFEGNQAIVDYLQRLLGYGITGLVREHVFPLFAGRGRNGKSILLSMLRETLGDYAGTVQPELLLDQGKSRNAAAPSPDIMALKGLRLAFADETEENSKFSSSRVKWLSGGSELTGRWPHEKRNSLFKPSHLLILSTNHKPKVSGTDYAFWSRMRLIKFNLSYIPNPQAEHERLEDPDRLKNILAKEKPRILGWLVEGCLKWQRYGLKPPAEVLEATKEYQADEDPVGKFVNECLDIEPGLACRASKIYELFKSWWAVNEGRLEPSQHWLGRQLGERFDRRKSNGTIKYFGIDIQAAAWSEYQPKVV